MPHGPQKAGTAAVWLAALVVLPAALAQSTSILPGECLALGQDFNWNNFDYTAMFTSPENITQGCTLRLSSLYMRGTCTSERNNQGSGCSSGSGGTVVNASSCEAVFAEAPAGALHTMPVPSTSYVFDSGSLCTKTDVGFVFAAYNCTGQTTPSLPVPLGFDITIQWTKYSRGCNSTTFPSWARYIIGVISGLVAISLFAFAFARCFRSRPMGPTGGVVQLAPPPTQQHGYDNTAATSYYTGSAAYGAVAGVTPPSYAGAWGAAPAGYPAEGQAGGYGYGYNQPSQSQHFLPPMTTVTLGQPGTPEDSGSQPVSGAPVTGTPAADGSGSLYPRPSGGAGAAPNTSGDAQAKV